MRGTVLADRYELQDLLGTGGMGRVWRAHDRLLDRTVAVKVLGPELAGDPAAIARLRTEAARAASVRHPNVVQVFDAVFDDDVAAIVLQLVDGPDLQSVVPAEGLPTEEALELIEGVAAGLAAAHAAGVVHRDVTPRNVLLDAGVPRLTDFGIARSLDATAVATRTVRGSVGYLAPEQASGGNVGSTADVYALGCLSTYLLTGRPPFSAESPVGVVHQHMTATPDDVRERAPSVPEEVALGIAASLRKDPRERPQDVAAFLAALGRSVPEPPPMLETVASAIPTPATGQPATAAWEPGQLAADGTQVLSGLETTQMIPVTRDAEGVPPVGRRRLMLAASVVALAALVAGGLAAGGSAPPAVATDQAPALTETEAPTIAEVTTVAPVVDAPATSSSTSQGKGKATKGSSKGKKKGK